MIQCWVFSCVILLLLVGLVVWVNSLFDYFFLLLISLICSFIRFLGLRRSVVEVVECTLLGIFPRNNLNTCIESQELPDSLGVGDLNAFVGAGIPDYPANLILPED